MNAGVHTQAVTLLRTGDIAGALRLLDRHLSDHDRDAEAWHLKAMALGQAGRLDEAEPAFHKAAVLHAQPGIILTNLGNALWRADRTESALAAYESASLKAPDHGPASLGAGLAYLALERLDEATRALEAARDRMPGQAAPLSALGRLYVKAGRDDLALEQFNAALAVNPRAAPTLLNRSALLRKLGRLDAALADARLAIQLQPGSPDAHLQLAHGLRRAGRTDEAHGAFMGAVQRAPLRGDIHEDAANFLWEQGAEDRFTDALDQVLSRQPDAGLLTLKARMCLRAGLLEPALAAAEQAVELTPESAGALSVRATLRRHAGQTDLAEEDFKAALSCSEATVDTRHEYAELLLSAHRFEDAATLLEDEVPDSSLQRHVALKTLTWRALGDSRYRDLYDYETLTRATTIETPKGFESLEAFNAALADSIRRLHTSSTHPLDQTLYGGTQSEGRLWDVDDPVIQALAGALQKAAEAYVSALPDDPAHPFLKLKSERLRLTGAWSVILRSGGGHVDHFHPAGWISASYYVQVPDTVMSGQKSGWLRLGGSGVTGLDLPAEHYVRPEPGLAVFFPSYMWHGVEAFEATDERITAPFDLVPA
jgi:Tfp pilus assembly protein PilF